MSWIKELNLSKSKSKNIPDTEDYLDDILKEYLSFNETENLKHSDFSDFTIDNVEDIGDMFGDCSDELKMKVLEQFKYSEKKPFKIKFYNNN